MGECRIRVFESTCIVTTHPKSQALWIASGECQGQRHQATGPTQTAAIKAWVEWARSTGEESAISQAR
jgi:hypothetical protein